MHENSRSRPNYNITTNNFCFWCSAQDTAGELAKLPKSPSGTKWNVSVCLDVH